MQPNADRAREIVERTNQLLAPDEWMLTEHKQMSARPVYAPARTGTGTGAAVASAHGVATRIDTAHISQQLTRMEGAVDTDPELAIGTAKEFVERRLSPRATICKPGASTPLARRSRPLYPIDLWNASPSKHNC